MVVDSFIYPILTLNMLPNVIIKLPTTTSVPTQNQPNEEVCSVRCDVIVHNNPVRKSYVNAVCKWCKFSWSNSIGAHFGLLIGDALGTLHEALELVGRSFFHNKYFDHLLLSCEANESQWMIIGPVRASVRLIYQNSRPFRESNHVRYGHLQGYLETDVKFQI